MKRKAGYSLFEVMIAFVILTLVLSVLIPGQVRFLGRATAVDEQVLALDFAHSRLDYLRVIGPFELGETNFEYRNWRVYQTIASPPDLHGVATSIAVVTIEIKNNSGTTIATSQTLMALH